MSENTSDRNICPSLTPAQYSELIQRLNAQAMEIMRLRQLLDEVPFYINVESMSQPTYTVTGISGESTLYDLCIKVGEGNRGGTVPASNVTVVHNGRKGKWNETLNSLGISSGDLVKAMFLGPSQNANNPS